MTELQPKRVVVEINNLTYQSDRDSVIFKDFSLSLCAGNSAIIHGPAGSGKSSLIDLLIGKIFANDGSVEVFGHLLGKRTKKIIRNNRRKIGGIGGLFSLIPSYTVAENVIYPLVINGESNQHCKERLSEVLTEFSLINLANEYPENLTRVENMLVQYARASVAYQPLLLIDEPLAGLDRTTYQRIYNYLSKMGAAGLTMIIVTSDDLIDELPNSKNYRIVNGALV